MVSPEPLDNSPPLPLSALSTSGSFSLSSSGSLQTHLSSFNSEQRLRTLPSVTADLEKQADSDSDNEVSGDDNRQTAVKHRFWWLVMAFVLFSALFFPISVLGDYGFLPPRPSVNPFSGDYESGPRCRPKGRIQTHGMARPLISLGKRATLVQDNLPRSSTFKIPLLHFRRLLQLARSYGLYLVQPCRLRQYSCMATGMDRCD